MGERTRLMALWAGWALVACGVTGCGKALPIGLDEEAPDGRIHAIVDAAREGDSASIAALIEQLDSDDPAVRLFAIRSIERISGRRFGYDHAAGVHAREASIRAMMEELGLGASRDRGVGTAAQTDQQAGARDLDGEP